MHLRMKLPIMRDYLNFLKIENLMEEGMEDLAKLHDEALRYEQDILIGTEKLENIRLRMIQGKNPSVLDDVLLVLDDISNDVERYREWIKEL